MLSRRSFIAGIGAGAAIGVAGGVTGFPHIARAAAPFTQPALPYAENALEPAISARTVGLHYGKHHRTYFDTLNRLVEGTPYADMDLEAIVREARGVEADRSIFNNAGQAWNHVLYWEQFQPGGAKEPPEALAERMEADFGGLDGFKEQFGTAAGAVFGSGWVWLAQDGETLKIVGTQGGDSTFAQGMTTLMGIDVWEHAYYLDYENRRPEHVKAVLDNLVNWDYVAGRMAEKLP